MSRFRPALGAAVLAALFISLPAPSLPAQAVPTRLLVRVLAHDAKIIGSGVGERGS